MDYKICKNCFQDDELVGFIVSNSITSNCSICKSVDVECIDFGQLSEFFSDLFENFKLQSDGCPLSELIQNKWSFFKNIETAQQILNLYLKDTHSEIVISTNKVEIRDDILENVDVWEKLKTKLISENRYITDTTYLTDNLKWKELFKSNCKLTKSDILYRARLHEEKDLKAFTESDMFSPPKDKSTAGRANPLGIPFLYLCDNRETVLYEIRALYLDEVSIGTFHLKDEIKEDIFINDFTEIPSIYYDTSTGIKNAIILTLLKEKISAELSKPLRRYDTELEYIPTQFICEFIKKYTNVKGIKFKSSLHNIGNNVVIFDQDIMKCIKVEKEKVNIVNIQSILVN
jgi:hypothetical protein